VTPPLRAGQATTPSPTVTPQPPHASQTIQAVSEEVLLDLVVRDRKGRAITDLKVDELEVFEDGVKQKINTFRFVEKRRVASSHPDGGEVQVDPLRHVNLVTLVFERLDVQARQLARQAANDFLDKELRPDMLVAVFTIDQRLYVLQQFTNDRRLLEDAVEQATRGNYTQFAAQSAAIEADLAEVASTGAVAQASGEAAAAGLGRNASAGAGMGTGFAAAKMAEMTVAILQFSRQLQQSQEGHASIYSLMALMKDQGRLAGRKTLIYFAEGLVVPPNLVEQFRSTISAANRANVSVYAVDARGLFTAGVNDATRQGLMDLSAVSKNQVFGESHPVTREEAMSGESAEASLRANVQGTLADLANSTGGFLIANTNDFRSGIQHVAEDIRTYYELSYTPTAREYDGRFRRITVKVSRPGVTLQTRSGYFALPPSVSPSTLPYEMPMLAALNTTPLPRDFEYHVEAFHFERHQDGVDQTVAMRAPLSNFTFTEDPKNKLYRGRVSLLGLIKDAEGTVVHKFSQNYPLEGPLQKLAAKKTGNIIFTHNLRLPPGRYTLETVTMDQQTKRASARRAVLLVPPERPGISMSSLAIVRSAEPVTGGASDNWDPFRYGDKTIIPNLDEPIVPAANRQLALYLVVYPHAEEAEKPQLALQFLKDGELVAQALPELQAPDAQGRIPCVGSLPLSTFKPGRYEVRAVVRQGSTGAEEHAFFTVNP
jgi:VWFA-related protein